MSQHHHKFYAIKYCNNMRICLKLKIIYSIWFFFCLTKLKFLFFCMWDTGTGYSGKIEVFCVCVWFSWFLCLLKRHWGQYVFLQLLSNMLQRFVSFFFIRWSKLLLRFFLVHKSWMKLILWVFVGFFLICGWYGCWWLTIGYDYF